MTKATTSAVTAYLAALIAAPDAQASFAECFTVTLLTGTTLYYTNVDQPVTYNGHTFLANGPLVNGLRYKAAVGLDVDKQQITFAARPTDTVSGNPWLTLIRGGGLDGGTIQRDRVFFTSGLGSSVVGGVTLFHGRVSTIDSVGRTSATITVASDLVVLDYDMPRNLYSTTCLWTLYATGCSVSSSSFATTAAVGAGSTTTIINWASASASFAQGKITFTSGVNADISATVKAVAVGDYMTLMYPLPSLPASGDGFTVYFGCNHTRGDCQSKFDNLVNFRAFPFVPPAQLAL